MPPAKKPAAKKSAPKKAPPKKTIAKKAPAKKTAAKKPAAKKASAKKPAAKKSAKPAAKDKVKKAPGPYMVFCKEMRPKIIKAKPSLTFGEVGKALGAEWKKLSDAQKAKYKK